MQDSLGPNIYIQFTGSTAQLPEGHQHGNAIGGSLAAAIWIWGTMFPASSRKQILKY